MAVACCRTAVFRLFAVASRGAAETPPWRRSSEWEGAATTLVSSSFPREPEELILSCLLFWEEEGSRNKSLEITGAVTQTLD